MSTSSIHENVVVWTNGALGGGGPTPPAGSVNALCRQLYVPHEQRLITVTPHCDVMYAGLTYCRFAKQYDHQQQNTTAAVQVSLVARRVRNIDQRSVTPGRQLNTRWVRQGGQSSLF